jgi:hypothetical protein
MPQTVFEIACVAIVIVTLVLMARQEPPRALLASYVSLALAGWVAEESCILLYGFYGYADVWSVKAHLVPLLVPLIWPLVILSARSFVQALWPGDRWWSHVLVGAVVAFDASLVEVVAVRAGLWWWAEPGHLDVPVIGMLGWGYFAVGASVALSLTQRWRYPAVLFLGLLSTHVLILATWWGLFRWTLRGDLGSSSTVGILVIGLIAAGFILLERRRGRGMPMQVAGPRMLAAGLFLVLLLTTAAREMPYWWHVIALSIPYLASVRFPSPVALKGVS